MSDCTPLAMSEAIDSLEARVSRLEQALPPVPPPAAEPAHSPAQEPADTAVEGRAAACSPLEQLLGKWPGDESDAELVERLRAMDIPSKPLATMAREPWERVSKLCVQLRHTVGVLENGDDTPEACGIELLRISNQLATESKRLRSATAPVSPETPAITRPVRDHVAEVTPSGGAEALPSGWYRIGDTRYAYGSAFWDVAVPRVDKYGRDPGYRAFAAGASMSVSPWPPTLAQAMCAALSITMHLQADFGWDAELDGYVIAKSDTADSCARAALEAFHARQQPAPARPDDACKCTYQDDGHRVVSRWCDLHGAAWQTLAEQRSELHEDGTPRAGCVFCNSSPELDASERGLPR